ncbi:hypothetical protein [Corynebacterium sp.]|uniref:hypothetical protein n=1 Tax=Corynebacterium sp. TaxID=1720 RepID=UPI0026DD45DD|nr:hypothetical protein [Corynebacterium sp.]MDO5076113.1 hypothetical protein [Corynebacterium sp.]
MRTQRETTTQTRQGIRIFTVLTGLTVLLILAWHIIDVFFAVGVPTYDLVLGAALFGVFLGGIYPGFLGRQSLGGTVAAWIGGSLPLGIALGLSAAYLIWVLG